MTCIIGYVDDEGSMYLAGDSAASAGYDLTIKRTPKVFAKGGMLIGVAGYWRMAQIIQYLYDFPEHEAEVSTEEYIVAHFVEGLREAVRDAGHVRKEMEQERHESSILVAYQGQLFEIEGNYQVTDTKHNFYAIGSGAPYALGVMYATEGSLSDEPLLRLKLALEAAEEFSTGVRAPFSFVSMATLVETEGAGVETDAERDEDNG